MTRSSSESGNVFFLILASVAILAGLSWAFTQNSRTSSGALTADQNRMAAQEIIAYGNQIADTIQKLKLRGCQNDQFNFANTAWVLNTSVAIHGVGHNPTAAPSGCGLFTAGEGNLTPQIFPSSYFDLTALGNIQPGSSRIRKVSMKGVGTENQEDVVYMLPKLKKDVCEAINKILSVPTINNTVPSWVETANDYNGIFAAGEPPYTDTNGLLSGKTMFCALQDNYSFVTVILTR